MEAQDDQLDNLLPIIKSSHYKESVRLIDQQNAIPPIANMLSTANEIPDRAQKIISRSKKLKMEPFMKLIELRVTIFRRALESAEEQYDTIEREAEEFHRSLVKYISEK